MFKNITPRKIYYAFICSVKGGLSIILLLSFLELEMVHLVALGSSSFKAYSSPHSHASRTKTLVYSYLVGTIVGMICSYIDHLLYPFFPGIRFFMGGVAVAFTIGILILLNFEHPPAAGVAIGFVLNPWGWRTPIFLMTAIIGLTVIRRLLMWWHPKELKKEFAKK